MTIPNRLAIKTFVSCLVESLQREARQLLGSGWVIENAAFYWMFPVTNHVEIAAKLVCNS
jgi:tRNA/tmRNA/rRNA uracil-C5-methylase (TrmA/RlmC/RlmD family)